jgi:hypothetical protein
MAKQWRRTLKRTAGGLETQILSRGKSMTKKAFNLGKTAVEEFTKERIKDQMKSAVKSMGKQALKPAIIYGKQYPAETHIPHKVHFKDITRHSPERSHKATVWNSPSPTTRPKNTSSCKATYVAPEGGVIQDRLAKNSVRRKLKFE